MRNASLFLAIGLAALSSPAGANHHEVSAQDCWKPAFQAGDADAVSACYAEDATLWLPGSPAMKGREAIRAGYADFFSHFSIKSVEITQGGHESMGDSAASWGSFRIALVSRDDGKESFSVGRYTDVSRKVGGKWLYVVDHASDDPPAAN